MSNRSHDDASPPRSRGGARDVAWPPLGGGVRGVLALGLLAGAAACSSAPQYPIHEGERAGNGTVMSVQPRYAVSAQDAAQNAADRQAQAGYPAYNAPPMAEPAAPAPGASPYGDAPPPAMARAPGADDMADDAPKAPVSNGGAVDSSDLPPPGAAPASSGRIPPVPPPEGQSITPPADVPPADPAASPHEIAYAYGGGQVVFGTDWVVQPTVELAAYHRHHHAAASETTESAKSAVDDTAESPSSSRKHRRHGKATAEAADEAPATETHAAAADTAYQTVVKPGETLGEVAERIHSSKAALTALNDLKHPRHVKPGTVLKIPYRYSYEVQKGDTLYTIAHRFNQAPEQIAKLNGLKAIPTLQPGQSIQLPPDASDQGKRDHASASGPEPVAAPEKVADAALRKVEKTERRSRRSRAAELNSAEAALPPQEIRHGRGRSEAPAEASVQPTPPLSPSPPAVRSTGTVASSQSAAIPPPVTPTETTPSRTTTVAAAPVQTPRAVTPAPVAPRPYVTTPSAAYAGRTAVPAAGVAAAATGGSTLARPSAVAPSTYTAPGYAARGVTAPSAASQYASATPPRYTPGYPATGGYASTGGAAAGPYTPSLGRERPVAPALSGGAATAGDITSAGRGRFIWPLRGPVVSGFGAKGTGEYNNGVDISAAPGTGVRAAAAGDVVYAGSSIPGYGNMVLIKHTGGWVTAYAHLNRIEVRMHDTVSQGDEIGQAGQTGVVDRPELYFEVRYAASAADRPRPVDPALVLPAGGG